MSAHGHLIRGYSIAIKDQNKKTFSLESVPMNRQLYNSGEDSRGARFLKLDRLVMV